MRVIRDWLDKLNNSKVGCDCPVCQDQQKEAEAFLKETTSSLAQESKDIQMMIFNYYELPLTNSEGEKAVMISNKDLIRILSAMGDVMARLLAAASNNIGEQYKKDWFKAFIATVDEIANERKVSR